MTDPGPHHHLEIKEGEETVAAADVTIPPGTGTAQASLRAAAGQIPPGRRSSLVDAVMDLPDVRDSDRLEAALPLGDAETLARLRERSENSTTRAAGASALLDADIPAAERPDPGPVGSGPVGSGPVGSGPVGSGPVGPGSEPGPPRLQQGQLLHHLVDPVARADHAERGDAEVVRLGAGQFGQVVVVHPVGLG
jgi:hypothetical protein